MVALDRSNAPAVAGNLTKFRVFQLTGHIPMTFKGDQRKDRKTSIIRTTSKLNTRVSLSPFLSLSLLDMQFVALVLIFFIFEIQICV